MASRPAHIAVLVVLASSLAGIVACERTEPKLPGAVAATSVAANLDDYGDTIAVGSDPQRVVSLNPTTTEIVFALGRGSRLVGRTRWDAHPDSARLVPDLGDGLRPNVEAVLGTRPDLVMLYAGADNRDAAQAFHRAGVRTLTLRIDSIAQFRRAVRIVGLVFGDTARARLVIDTVDATLDRVRQSTAALPHPRAFWKAWDSPLLAIGGGSFLTELLEIAGARNIYSDLASPSPQVTLEDIVRRDPDIVIAGSNSAKVLETNPAWQAVRAVREHRIVIVDTLVVAFPAVRLGQAAEALARALHPDLAR